MNENQQIWWEEGHFIKENIADDLGIVMGWV